MPKIMLILFLYIDPIKQGLKHISQAIAQILPPVFLYIDPIKQGLKQKFLKEYLTEKQSFYT